MTNSIATARVNMLHPAAGDATYIISAEREALGPSGSGYNAEAMDKLAGRLERIRARGLAYNIHEVAGAYQGRPEASLAVVGRDTPALWQAVKALGQAFHQDSVLAVTPDGAGILAYMDGRAQDEIGQMVAAAPAELEGLEAYSVIKSTGEAFTFV